MIYKKLLIILAVVFVCSYASGATYYDVDAGALTGGATGALDNVSVTQIANGYTAKVTTSTYTYFYKYDATSASAESSPSVIIPDDNTSGTGAWILKRAYVQDASTAEVGLVELATSAETVTGTDTGRAVTPAGLTSRILDEDDMASDSASYLATQQSIKAYVDGSQKIAQVVTAQETGVVSPGNTAIPFDDSIPQNTEGEEIITLAITPTNQNSTLVINFDGTASFAAQNIGTVALFENNVVNAIAAAGFFVNANGYPCPAPLSHTMTAATEAEITFKIRIGAAGASQVTVNGSSGGRRYGGVASTMLTVTEVLP